MKSPLAVALVVSVFAFTDLSAAGGKTYQVTGTVVEVTAIKIVVQKGTERWELDVGPETKGSGQTFKAGDKVTITYTMTASSIEGHSKTGAASPAATP